MASVPRQRVRENNRMYLSKLLFASILKCISMYFAKKEVCALRGHTAHEKMLFVTILYLFGLI